MAEKKENTAEELVDAVIQGLQEKKGIEIVKVDLRRIEASVCKYFVICNGSSNTHVAALADAVEDFVRENINEKIWHKEGISNAQWVLLDYANVVVHIFQKEYRDFYKLESLWADAKITAIANA